MASIVHALAKTALCTLASLHTCAATVDRASRRHDAAAAAVDITAAPASALSHGGAGQRACVQQQRHVLRRVSGRPAPGALRCVVRDSNSGHELLLPPAKLCPIFASRTTQGTRQCATGRASCRCVPPELKVRTPAHTKQLGWYVGYVEFESRVTQDTADGEGQRPGHGCHCGGWGSKACGGWAAGTVVREASHCLPVGYWRACPAVCTLTLCVGPKR